MLLLSLPFLMNIYHGYIKRPQTGQLHSINCETISRKLQPYLSNIVHTIKSNGNKIDSSKNYGTGEGHKAIRDVFKHNLPEVCTLIDTHIVDLVKQSQCISGKHLKLANCVNEKYCWFLRLYDKDNDFLDWHFDNNFTKGLRYTMVNTIYVSDCNASHFMFKDAKNRTHVKVSKQGTGVLYNGSDVKHAISSQIAECTRIVLVVPLYETEEKSILGTLRLWARNISYPILKL